VVVAGSRVACREAVPVVINTRTGVSDARHR
jgi:hypothetical protein